MRVYFLHVKLKKLDLIKKKSAFLENKAGLTTTLQHDCFTFYMIIFAYYSS